MKTRNSDIQTDKPTDNVLCILQKHGLLELMFSKLKTELIAMTAHATISQRIFKCTNEVMKSFETGDELSDAKHDTDGTENGSKDKIPKAIPAVYGLIIHETLKILAGLALINETFDRRLIFVL